MKCRCCGCTDLDACSVDDGQGCDWIADNLCSVCFEMAGHLATFFVIAGPGATRAKDTSIFQRVVDEAFTFMQNVRESEPSVLLATEDDMRAMIEVVKP
jgi:hypothetical protein